MFFSQSVSESTGAFLRKGEQTAHPRYIALRIGSKYHRRRFDVCMRGGRGQLRANVRESSNSLAMHARVREGISIRTESERERGETTESDELKGIDRSLP